MNVLVRDCLFLYFTFTSFDLYATFDILGFTMVDNPHINRSVPKPLCLLLGILLTRNNVLNWNIYQGRRYTSVSIKFSGSLIMGPVQYRKGNSRHTERNKHRTDRNKVVSHSKTDIKLNNVSIEAVQNSTDSSDQAENRG